MVDRTPNALLVSSPATLAESQRPRLGTDPESVRFALNRWAGTLSKGSLRTYSEALQDFAKFCGMATPEHAISAMIQSGRQGAKLLLLEWQANQHKGRGLAPATVNTRLAAVKSFLAFSEDLDIVNWTVKVKPIKSKILRDTAGPGTDAVRTMVKAAADRQDPKGIRDTAILRLLHDLGLRRKEIVGLDLEHVDLIQGRLSILGKARTEREFVTLPPETCKALEGWISVRGDHAGPLFTSLSNHGRGGRMAGQSLYNLIRTLGKTAAGVRTSPHRLRHTSITTACDVEHDLHKVKAFSRHASVDMVGTYHDNLTDAGGEVAKLVAATI